MEQVFDILSWVCLIVGSVFCVIGGIGLIRLPDFYSRMHGGGITDTLGVGLVLIGLMFQGGGALVTIKLVAILLIALLASPTSTHAVAKAAYKSGLMPHLQDEGDR